MIRHAGRDLWGLVLDQQTVDPGELAAAVAEEASRQPLDFRTRLLIRDSMAALQRKWPLVRFQRWLQDCPTRRRLEAISQEDLGKPGFPFLDQQLMEPTRPEAILLFLREVGGLARRPTRVDIGGSAALILGGFLSRRTQDVDVVDEVPAEIRGQHAALNAIMQRHRLELAHFQSHYLPIRWQERTHSLELLGNLEPYLIDVHDVFLSKLFSAREKDLDDLRALSPQLDKQRLTRLLLDDCAATLAAPALRERAEKNWYILYGETLPS
ncbi:MAG: hypothetical protein JNM56_00060 [Planctomycetia bacterium]|nr:hypothetical protein [Planctomycetia bacterium]